MRANCRGLQSPTAQSRHNSPPTRTGLPFVSAVHSRLADYLQLMRLDRPIGIWLLLWPTLWGLWLAAEGVPPLGLLLIFVAGTVLMRSAGCVINDYADREFDPHVERTRDRPLAAGRVSERQALALFVALILLAGVLVLPLGRAVMQWAIPAVLLAASYPFAKRFHSMPQAHLGLAFAWGIPMAWTAATGSVHWPQAAPLMAATVVWAIAYDSFYALVDIEDDEKIGVRSSARLFGARALGWVALFQALTLALLLWVGQIAGLGRYYMAALIAAGALSLWQQWLARTQGRDGCFRAFLNNHPLGFLILAGLVLDLSA